MLHHSKVLKNSHVNKNYLFNIKPASNTIPSTVKNIIYNIKEDRNAPTHENVKVLESSVSTIFPINQTSSPTQTNPKRLMPSRSKEKVLLKTIAFPINPSDKNQIDGVYGSFNEKIYTLKKNPVFSIAGNEGLYQVQAFINDNNEIIPDFEHPYYKIGDVVSPRAGNTGTWCDYKVLYPSSLGTPTRVKDYLKVESGVDLSPEGSRGFGILEAATAAVNGCTALGFAELFQQNVYEKLRKDRVNPGGNTTDFYCFANAGNSQVSKLFSQIVHSDYSYKNYREFIGDHLKTISVLRSRETAEKTDAFIEKIKTESKTDMVITETDNQNKEMSKKFSEDFKDKDVNFIMAINSVGGSSVSSIERKLSNNAKVYTYGGMSMKGIAASTTAFIFKNISYLGFWITKIFRENKGLKSTYFGSLAKLYDSKQIALNADDYHVIEWKVKSDSNGEILKKIQDGIQLKGKKAVVYVNHEE